MSNKDTNPKEDLKAYKEKVLQVLHTRLAQELAGMNTDHLIWAARHSQGVNVCRALIEEIESL